MTKPNSPSRLDKRNLLSKQILELHNQGFSDPKIALHLGLSDSTIQRHRTLYLKVPAHMPEINYENELDRTKGYMIRNIKHSAKRTDREFDLVYQDLELPTHCPLLEIPLVYRHQEGHSNDFDRATIDRIDTNKGYVKDNVWVISRLANTMKSSSTLDQLELFAINALKFIENQRARGSITDSESLDS